MDFSNFSNTELAIIIGIIIVFAYKFFVKKIDEEGRIKDEFVKTDNVIEVLSTFKMKYQSNLKDGYTEKSIQNQLKKHLLNHFVNVVDEYGIEGINGTKIDFDIGNGKVGLELKLAKAIYKTANYHRLSGQIEDYMYNKYDNLIVVIFGEKVHSDERTHLSRIKSTIEEKGAIFYYSELPVKVNSKKQ